MWRMVVDDADPAGMFDEAEKLQRLAEHLGEITTQAHAVAKDVLGAWEGQAAEGAAGQITAFLRWADDTANTTNNIAGLLGQYAHVVNRARLSMPYPVQAGGLTPQGDTTTAPQAAASKTEAVHVMEHYATQSRDIYSQLGQHQFTAPPSSTGLPLPPPAPEPHAPVHQPPTPTSATTPSAVSMTTTPSDFTGQTTGVPDVPTGGVAGTVPGLPAAGQPSGGLPGAALTGGGAGSVIVGPPATSGIGATEAEAGVEPVTSAAMEEPAGWNGFAPMGTAGRTPGDQDGDHRNKYGQDSGLIGELPPTFPPVIGL
jgi:hypothetical protein